MTAGARFVSILFWAFVAFLVAPSKVAAMAYLLLLGGAVIVVFVGLGLGTLIAKQVSALLKRG